MLKKQIKGIESGMTPLFGKVSDFVVIPENVLKLLSKSKITDLNMYF